LAQHGNRTVVSTIHQPNSDIFEKFDRLLLLARGKIIYFNEASKSVEYFASINFPCPELSNPCDYFMTMMSKESIEFECEDGEINQAEIDTKYEELINMFDRSYQKSPLRCDANELVETKSLEGKSVLQQTPWFYQFNLLAKRNFLNLVRLPQTSYVKLITTAVTAIFAALLFWKSGAPVANANNLSPVQLEIVYNQEFQNLQGSLFFMTMNISFNAIQNVILIFPDERPVFLREVNNNMYSVGPYFWAKVISEFPFALLTPCLFGAIVYFCVDLNPGANHFAMFLLILVLVYNASSGYSLIISASFSDKQLAVTLTPVLIIPFMLFAGFFVSTTSIPWFLKEFEYLSIFKYGYQALMQNQFVDNSNFPCAEDYAANSAADPALYGCDASDDWPCYYEKGCNANPLTQIGTESLLASLMCLLGLYVFCYLMSWFLLSRLSKTYD